MKRLLFLLLIFSGCDKISPSIGTNERGLLAGTLPAVLRRDNQVKFVEKNSSIIFPWQKLELIDVADKDVEYSFDENLRPNKDLPLIKCKVSYRVRDSKDDILSFRRAFSTHGDFVEFLQSELQSELFKKEDLDEILFSDSNLLRESLAGKVTTFGVDLTDLNITEFFDEKAINSEKQTVAALEQKITELKELLSQKKDGLSNEHAAQVTVLQNKLVSAEAEADLIRKKADGDFEIRKKAAEDTLETGRVRLKELEEVASLLGDRSASESTD